MNLGPVRFWVSLMKSEGGPLLFKKIDLWSWLQKKEVQLLHTIFITPSCPAHRPTWIIRDFEERILSFHCHIHRLLEPHVLPETHMKNSRSLLFTRFSLFLHCEFHLLLLAFFMLDHYHLRTIYYTMTILAFLNYLDYVFFWSNLEYVQRECVTSILPTLIH